MGGTWERCETHATFYPKNPKRRDHLGDIDVGGRIILKHLK